MGWESILLALLPAVLAVILVMAGIEDARVREIADGKNIAIALLAPAWWWSNGLALWPDVAIQLLVAAVVFGLFAAAFAVGLMGGGDVKMIAALALWFPFPLLGQFLVAMSLAGGAVTVAMMADRWWRRGAAIEVPYGVAIAAAGLLCLGEPILNHSR